MSDFIDQFLEMTKSIPSIVPDYVNDDELCDETDDGLCDKWVLVNPGADNVSVFLNDGELYWQGGPAADDEVEDEIRVLISALRRAREIRKRPHAQGE